ncbi:alpha/beta fold hydrolase [Thermogemmatispora tikiterensis]|nr:alpha/beta hydrolase [Thermogemmatispora tikiterensis]
MPVQEQWIQTGAITTHSWIGGDPANPALVLLHGAGPGASAAANWERILPDLAGDFYVIAPDLVGFGETSLPRRPWPRGWTAWMGLRVEQVLGLLDALQVHNAHLIGNSMGGYLALQLLIEVPERFGPSLLMGPAGGAFTPGPELALMRSFSTDLRPARLKQVFRAFLYSDEAIPDLDELVERRYALAAQPEALEAYEAMMVDGPTPLPPALLSRIRHPILILHGRFDRIVPLESSIWLLQHLQAAELKVYDRCGHWIQLERWEAMQADIRAFLQHPMTAARRHEAERTEASPA